MEPRWRHIVGRTVRIPPGERRDAAPGETLVTGTVKDLLTGTPLAFQQRDAHQLRGIEGRWPLFAVSGEVA